MMTWCAPCNNHGNDWCKAATAERLDADYAGVEEEVEEMETEDEEEVKQSKRTTYIERVVLTPGRINSGENDKGGAAECEGSAEDDSV